MRKNLILYSLIIFLITIFVSLFAHNASAVFQPYPQEDPSLPLVQLQLTLLDSDRNLVAYIEPTTLYIANVPLIHDYLDTKEGTIYTKFSKNGKTFEQYEWKDYSTFRDEVKQFASYVLIHQEQTILIFRHDGYLAGEGDLIYAYWKIIRIAN